MMYVFVILAIVFVSLIALAAYLAHRSTRRRNALRSIDENLNHARIDLRRTFAVLDRQDGDVKLPRSLKEAHEAKLRQHQSDYQSLLEAKDALLGAYQSIGTRPKLAYCQSLQRDAGRLRNRVRKLYEDTARTDHTLRSNVSMYSPETLANTTNRLTEKVALLVEQYAQCAPYFSVREEQAQLKHYQMQLQEVAASIDTVEHGIANYKTLRDLDLEISNFEDYGLSEHGYIFAAIDWMQSGFKSLKEKRNFIAGAPARLADGIAHCREYVTPTLDKQWVRQLNKLERKVKAYAPAPTMSFTDQKKAIDQLEGAIKAWIDEVDHYGRSSLRQSYSGGLRHESSSRSSSRSGSRRSSGSSSDGFSAAVYDSGSSSSSSHSSGSSCSSDSGGGFSGGCD